MQGDPMGVDPGLLAALNEALQRAPDSIPLRLHVAGLLMQSGGEAAALQHYVTILTKDPASVPALEGAAAAAEAIGDPTRASGYRRLLAALRGAATEPPPAATHLESAPQRTEPVPVAQEPGGSPPWWEVEWPNLRLKDVGGMQQVKRRLDVAFLGPMRNPELRKAYGKSLRGGLLLYGPPGCGKTFIARATAGELGARFLGIGLSDVLDMWFGNSERRLHEIFQHARRSAPCVVFFDELDAIGQKRANLQGAGSMRNVVNQLLAEMDGIGPDNEGVFLLGATNHPWDVDSALLRPGRFDRMALVLPPDEPARIAILEHHLKGKPATAVDVKAIASKTEGFSGADLAHLCESATELAMEESVTSGTVRSITTVDFGQALRQVKPSTRSWFETARNFVLFANQSGTYDDLQEYMRSKKLL
jgi:AAA+ superfamily predicted ATPase